MLPLAVGPLSHWYGLPKLASRLPSIRFSSCDRQQLPAGGIPGMVTFGYGGASAIAPEGSPLLSALAGMIALSSAPALASVPAFGPTAPPHNTAETISTNRLAI